MAIPKNLVLGSPISTSIQRYGRTGSIESETIVTPTSQSSNFAHHTQPLSRSSNYSSSSSSSSRRKPIFYIETDNQEEEEEEQGMQVDSSDDHRIQLGRINVPQTIDIDDDDLDELWDQMSDGSSIDVTTPTYDVQALFNTTTTTRPSRTQSLRALQRRPTSLYPPNPCSTRKTPSDSRSDCRAVTPISFPFFQGDDEPESSCTLRRRHAIRRKRALSDPNAFTEFYNLSGFGGRPGAATHWDRRGRQYHSVYHSSRRTSEDSEANAYEDDRRRSDDIWDRQRCTSPGRIDTPMSPSMSIFDPPTHQHQETLLAIAEEERTGILKTWSFKRGSKRIHSPTQSNDSGHGQRPESRLAYIKRRLSLPPLKIRRN